MRGSRAKVYQPIVRAAWRYFESQGCLVEQSVPLGGGLFSRGRMPLFRVSRHDLTPPRPVIMATGSPNRKFERIHSWLTLVERSYGFFVLDEMGALYYVEGCTRCPGISKVGLETYLDGLECQHGSKVLKPEDTLPVYRLQSDDLLKGLSSFLEAAGPARDFMDIMNGHYLLYEEEGKLYKLFSPKYCARRMAISSNELRNKVSIAGGKPLTIKRFGELMRLWTLPPQAESEAGEAKESVDSVVEKPQ